MKILAEAEIFTVEAGMVVWFGWLELDVWSARIRIAEFCRGDTSEGEIKSCEQLFYYFLYRGTVSSLVCGTTCSDSGPRC